MANSQHVQPPAFGFCLLSLELVHQSQGCTPMDLTGFKSSRYLRLRSNPLIVESGDRMQADSRSGTSGAGCRFCQWPDTARSHDAVEGRRAGSSPGNGIRHSRATVSVAAHGVWQPCRGSMTTRRCSQPRRRQRPPRHPRPLLHRMPPRISSGSTRPLSRWRPRSHPPPLSIPD